MRLLSESILVGMIITGWGSEVERSFCQGKILYSEFMGRNPTKLSACLDVGGLCIFSLLPWRWCKPKSHVSVVFSGESSGYCGMHVFGSLHLGVILSGRIFKGLLRDCVRFYGSSISH